MKLTQDNYPKESLDHNIKTAKERIKFIFDNYRIKINADFINSRKGYFRALFAALLGYPVRTPSGITELSFDYGLDDENPNKLNRFYIIIDGNRRIFRYLEKFVQVSLKDVNKKNVADLNCYYAFNKLSEEANKPNPNKDYLKTLIGVIFGYAVSYDGDPNCGHLSFCGEASRYKLVPFIKAKKVEEVVLPPVPVAVKPPLGPTLYNLNELAVGDYAEVVRVEYSGLDLFTGEKIVMAYGYPEEECISIIDLNKPKKTWINADKTAFWMKKVWVKKIQNPFNQAK